MRWWKMMALVAVLGGVASGCSNDTGVTVLQLRDSDGSLRGMSLDVTSGTTPTYSWTGGAARALAVRSSTGELAWQIEALDFGAGFLSPVTHGVVPSRAREVAQARRLISGVEHILTVVSVLGETESLSFTP